MDPCTYSWLQPIYVLITEVFVKVMLIFEYFRAQIALI